MARIRPLTALEAKRTLAHKFTRIADNLRMMNSRFGVRPFRCFLTWTKWTSQAGVRGDGSEELFDRVEVLPTPLVQTLDAVTFSIFHAGTVPAGSLRVEQISARRFTDDLLRGIRPEVVDPKKPDEGVKEPFDFFYEVVEDGRDGNEPRRQRYRLLSQPFRRAGKLDFSVMLERSGYDRDRADHSPFALPGRP